MSQAAPARENAVTVAQERRPLLVKTGLPMRLSSLFFHLFVFVTAVAEFVPLNPSMPRRGIDPAYSFSVNQAVARHLSFGSQIVFTYGPFGAVVSRMYDPLTDLRMLWASLIFGLCYVSAMFYLARGRKRIAIVCFLLLLVTFGPGELLLLSYPVLLVLCVVRYISGREDKSTEPGWPTLLAAIIMWATLGILPVVKGSLVLSYAAAVVLPPALLVCCSRFKHALLLFIIPIVASVALWVFAGQSLADLPGFVRGTAWLISGFAEAMSTPWSVLPAAIGVGFILFYLAVSVVLFLSVARSKELTTAPKGILALLLVVGLFVPFKHNFLGVSGLSSAFASLAVVLLLFQLLYRGRWLQWSTCLVVLATVATSVIRDPVLIKDVHERFGVGAAWSSRATRPDILAFCLQRALPAYERSTYKRTLSTYSDAWRGLSARLSHGDELHRRFLDALQAIRDSEPVPALNGTVDFYEYDQSVLLASANAWNPRPVLQSYSVYTPELAQLDEGHLRGSEAPDWLIIELQSIDERLPSLDDGLSWPAFLDNYTFVSYNSRYVVMRKKQSLRPSSAYVDVSEGTYRAGATVPLPNSGGLLFAQVDLKPTLAGRVVTALLNPPQLMINVGLEDGSTRTYRVVAKMMKTNFLLSPLVSDTKDFATLMVSRDAVQGAERVRSIRIAPSYGGSTYWAGTYTLKLQRYVGDSATQASHDFK